MKIELYPEEYLKVIPCFPAGYQVAIMGTMRMPSGIRPRTRGVRSFLDLNGREGNGYEVKPLPTEEEASAALEALEVVYTDTPKGFQMPAVDQVVGGHPVKQAVLA